MNAAILLWFQSIRTPFWNQVVLIFTYTINAACALPFLLLLIRKTRKQAALVCLSLTAVFLTVTLIKHIVQLPRPYTTIPGLERIGPAPGGTSFPSMHTALAFTLAWPFLFTRKKAGRPILVYSILIALSRLYLGVHYPTDILGGILISALVCALIVFLKGKLHASSISNT